MNIYRYQGVVLYQKDGALYNIVTNRPFAIRRNEKLIKSTCDEEIERLAMYTALYAATIAISCGLMIVFLTWNALSVVALCAITAVWASAASLINLTRLTAVVKRKRELT